MRIDIVYNKEALKGLKKLPDNCIDCVITSPPYWQLRDYGEKDQIGQEETFQEYIENLITIFNEVYRVLKNNGTCFVNLGDGYNNNKNENVVIRNKSLLLIPERFAISMIDNGWILRNQIIWHKPNQMPSPATDRFTVDFEKIFFFVKQKKYYFKQQFEQYTKPLDRWGGTKLDAKGESKWDSGTNQKTYRKRNMRPNADGKNMRTVWSVNTESYKGSHFAVFPKKLVNRMIKAGCPKKGIVLDPFMGSGTVAIQAKILQRHYLGFELNKKYVKMSEKRIKNELGLFNL